MTTAGTAYCWGNDAFGKLGDGTNTLPSPVPVAVSGGLTFRSVSTGTHHTCGQTMNGAAYCWGLDQNAANKVRDVPVLIFSP